MTCFTIDLGGNQCFTHARLERRPFGNVSRTKDVTKGQGHVDSLFFRGIVKVYRRDHTPQGCASLHGRLARGIVGATVRKGVGAGASFRNHVGTGIGLRGRGAVGIRGITIPTAHPSHRPRRRQPQKKEATFHALLIGILQNF